MKIEIIPNYENARFRDSKWLIEKEYIDIDPEKFSDWVTRVINDGFAEDEAREFVIKQISFKY